MTFKAALVAGVLLCPAPLLAQTAPDPLAPLPEQGNAPPAPEPLATVPPVHFSLPSAAAPATSPSSPSTLPRAANPVITEPPVAGPAPLPPAPAIVSAPAQTVSVPPPPPVIAVPRDWRGVFDAIRAQQWAAAQAGIAALGPSPLASVARAELYTARNSPKAGIDSLVQLLGEAPDLPMADQIARMAAARGATSLPPLPGQYRLVALGTSPRRGRARPVQGEPEADALRARLDPLIKANDADQAEAVLIERQLYLSPMARAEAAQRVAWAYYVLGRDADAQRVADTARVSGAGEWPCHGAWVSALASWRLRDYPAAVAAFRQVAASAPEPEMRTAALYWAARAEMANRNPAAVGPLLRAAAASSESFYGFIARQTLGLSAGPARPGPGAELRRVEALPNVQRATQLAQIGEVGLADQYLRFQARLGNPADHQALIAVARKLDLAATQVWLANFGPPGARVTTADRFPMPRWSPHNGWRIDPALAFAHTLQESMFRASVVSPAGAVGLMQVLPSTANLMARTRGLPFGAERLTSPAANMEFGQSFIEFLRDSAATRGQLPKVIAAYNAGPLPVDRWNYINDQGDPLLWIESIPYWETRFYVPAVMRNLWVYQAQAGAEQTTLKAMAEHRWPAFPTGRSSMAVTFNR